MLDFTFADFMCASWSQICSKQCVFIVMRLCVSVLQDKTRGYSSHQRTAVYCMVHPN